MGVMVKTMEQDFNARIHPLAEAIKVALIERGEMLATAESCTGGLIASSIVNEPGSSAMFAGAVVAYQNQVKTELLGVSAEHLSQNGAVNGETVAAMAKGALEKFHCQWAIATSGIAGPTGAEPGKPVGTVWIAVANCLQNEVFCEKFDGDRQEIREKSVYSAMSRLIFLINNQKSTCTNEH